MTTVRNPRVTVVIPAYNAGKYIAQTIDSVLAQSLRDFELLVVDDGSTDDTVAIVGSRGDSRVRLLRMERNGGVSAAANWGIDSARGVYMARLDADDLMVPERLAAQVAFLDDHPEVAVCGGAGEVFGENAPSRIARYPEDDADIRCSMLDRSPFLHSTVMMRLDEIRRRGLRYDPALRYAEDYDFFERAAEYCGLANLPDVLAKYRRHAGQATTLAFDRLEAAAAQVRNRLLRRFIPDLTVEEFERHELMAGQRPIPDSAALSAVESWMRYLRGLSGIDPRLSRASLETFLACKWLNVCHRAPHDPTTLRRYLGSDLRAHPRRRIKELKLMLKCVAGRP